MKSLYEEKIVEIPQNCQVSLVDKVFSFKGPLGKQSYDASKFLFTFSLEESQIKISCWHSTRKEKSLLQTVATHIKNHVNGVVKGIKIAMRAAYKHFSINMSIVDNGKTVIVKNFLGTKHVLPFKMIGETKAMIGDSKDVLIIEGINVNDVTLSAYRISDTVFKRKKHDVRIFLDGIYVADKTKIVE